MSAQAPFTIHRKAVVLVALTNLAREIAVLNFPERDSALDGIKDAYDLTWRKPVTREGA